MKPSPIKRKQFGERRRGCRCDATFEMGSACPKIRRADFYGEVLINSGWRFCITPFSEELAVLVSEVVGQWHIPKPRQLQIPGPTKPKARSKRKKHVEPKAFNKAKPDSLS